MIDSILLSDETWVETLFWVCSEVSASPLPDRRMTWMGTEGVEFASVGQRVVRRGLCDFVAVDESQWSEPVSPWTDGNSGLNLDLVAGVFVLRRGDAVVRRIPVAMWVRERAWTTFDEQVILDAFITAHPQVGKAYRSN